MTMAPDDLIALLADGSPSGTRAAMSAMMKSKEASVVEGLRFALWKHLVSEMYRQGGPGPELGHHGFDPAFDYKGTYPPTARAAADLVTLIKTANQLGAHPMLELYVRDPEARRKGLHSAILGEFGDLIGRACLGGMWVGGFDWNVPKFRIGLNEAGDEIEWDGEAEPTVGAPLENPAWPSSSVQSLLFERGRYTERQAQRWAQDHGYRHTAVDTTVDYIHLRQFPPDGRPCRNIEFGHGVHAVVCATSNPGAEPTVLILEDDPKIQSALSRWVKKIFGAKNVHIAVADNVDAAVADLSDHDVKLIVSDVDVIGNKSGLDFFEHVKAQRPDLVDRFIFFTGNSAAQAVHYRYVPKGGATFEDFKRVYRADRADLEGGPAPVGASHARASTVRSPTVQVPAFDALLPVVRDAIPMVPASGRFGPDKIFIADLWRQIAPRAEPMGYSLPSFKRWLVEANRKRVLDLRRADLVGAMNRYQVEESEIDHMGQTSHFVYDDSADGAPRRAAPMTLAEFAEAVTQAMRRVPEGRTADDRFLGRFGDKVFIAAAWRALRDPRLSEMTLKQFKHRLLQANREQLLLLSRADAQGDMDTDELVASEIDDMGARFHFIQDMRRNGGMSLREFARLVSVELPYITVEPDVDGHKARGRFGRKVFISALWRQMKTHPRFDGMTLAQFKHRLLQAHRERLLTLTRADFVAAMDPREVAESELDADGVAQFHFVVDE